MSQTLFRNHLLAQVEMRCVLVSLTEATKFEASFSVKPFRPQRCTQTLKISVSSSQTRRKLFSRRSRILFSDSVPEMITAVKSLRGVPLGTGSIRNISSVLAAYPSITGCTPFSPSTLCCFPTGASGDYRCERLHPRIPAVHLQQRRRPRDGNNSNLAASR